METLAAIKNRRSIQKYKEDPVPLDLIGAVIEAGSMAPSAGDQQAWKFVVIQDEGARKAIADFSLEQYWIGKAPVLIVVVAEEDMMRKFYGVRGEKLYAIQNCAAAIENMLLAAQEFGLGACWVGAFDEHTVTRVAGVPDSARVQAIVTLGYPDETPEKKNIQPLERIMYIENYGSRIADPSKWFWDWSSVIAKEAKGAKTAISSILKKSFESQQKDFKTKWDKIQKKLNTKIQRPRY